MDHLGSSRWPSPAQLPGRPGGGLEGWKLVCGCLRMFCLPSSEVSLLCSQLARGPEGWSEGPWSVGGEVPQCVDGDGVCVVALSVGATEHDLLINCLRKGDLFLCCQ